MSEKLEVFEEPVAGRQFYWKDDVDALLQGIINCEGGPIPYWVLRRLTNALPQTATKAGAVNACQHKNRSGEVAQGRTMYEVCMDCGKRLDLITEGDAQP